MEIVNSNNAEGTGGKCAPYPFRRVSVGFIPGGYLQCDLLGRGQSLFIRFKGI